jgi:ATP-dependent Clp protease, protease subunit
MSTASTMSTTSARLALVPTTDAVARPPASLSRRHRFVGNRPERAGKTAPTGTATVARRTPPAPKAGTTGRTPRRRRSHERARHGGTLIAMSDLVLPSIVAQVGATPQDSLFQQLLQKRIVFLGSAIDDNVANLVCAQLILLDAEDDKDIFLYINSPGGSVTSGLAIYDTMQYVNCDVSTTCVGLAASMGQFLLCAGAPGKRYALPHSRILMHQPLGQFQGQAADIAIQAEQIMYLKRMMAERIAFHTGQPVERIEADSDRDRWFTAQEGKEYGFIDEVIEKAEAATSPTSG